MAFPDRRLVRHDGRTARAMLRPGNAGANDAEDHLELLDQVVAGLPGDYQVGTSRATIRALSATTSS